MVSSFWSGCRPLCRGEGAGGSRSPVLRVREPVSCGGSDSRFPRFSGAFGRWGTCATFRPAPGEREKLVSVAGTADCPQNDLRKTGSDGIVRSTVAVSGTKKSSQSGYIVLRLASGGPKFLLRSAVAADFLLSCRLLSTAGSGYAGDGEPGRCRRTRSPWPGGRFRVACPACRAVRVRAARDGAVFFSLGPGIGKNGPCAGAAVRVPPPRRVRRPGFPARAAVRIFGACATDTSESASCLRSRPARGVRLQRVRAARETGGRRAASEHDGLVAPLALRRRSDTYRGKRGRADPAM